ncbi:unnamed protein product [Tuber melanosporum]|uniref:(Perigord truffle) hypothetical protein n=1 Tax=Tuber melanosporum (strain Mel28) TaxID=656061 RepID=D5GGC6_TUBMM|nr:unnamed protein product [Tuber melanosporum]
MMYSSTRKTCS